VPPGPETRITTVCFPASETRGIHETRPVSESISNPSGASADQLSGPVPTATAVPDDE
jgi:hypothetical protein